jgi:hypothetical protein
MSQIAFPEIFASPKTFTFEQGNQMSQIAFPEIFASPKTVNLGFGLYTPAVGFDTSCVSGVNGNPLDGDGLISVADAINWTRLITIRTDTENVIFGVEIAVSSNPAKIRLTRSAMPGQPHGLLQTDMTQIGRYVLLATGSSGYGATMGGCTGTVNQPNAGDRISLNVFTEGCAEIGVEALATNAGPASIRVFGCRMTS